MLRRGGFERGGGIFTLLAADAVTVPLQERLPTDPDLLGLDLFKDTTSYKYTLANLGIIKITRRSVNLAAAACALQFATIQSTIICLTTTSPEELTKAFTGFFLLPLKWFRLVNVNELSLSILLSFRFLGLIFEELQNVAKGMLSRNINWKDLALVARIDIGTTLISKAINNLLSISNQIARSMMVRGYSAKSFVHPHLADVKERGNE
ncbi:cobalt transport protein [Chloropicon primus]|uniref:Cobalt transport protein n=1 Tax=Chloropicon primus TaxID=1764295 RepID=A0A5B8MFG4_9CHLO|nr:cobalt transport protein [Chloropicon primus]|eukprot:QDZ18934.1 cobalt transport protein [Chloropicon primus]